MGHLERGHVVSLKVGFHTRWPVGERVRFQISCMLTLSASCRPLYSIFCLLPAVPWAKIYDLSQREDCQPRSPVGARTGGGCGRVVAYQT
jgi:hypothetical protein